MNARDQANLEFLLNLSEDGLRNWYDQASEDDIAYASELLDSYELTLGFEEKGVVFSQQSTLLH